MGGGYSFGHHLNDAGQITGEANISAGLEHAFIYSNGQMTDLGSFGGSGSAGFGINNAGQVVGSASTPSGFSHAFVYSNGQMKDLGTLPGYDISYANDITNARHVTGRSKAPVFILNMFFSTATGR